MSNFTKRVASAARDFKDKVVEYDRKFGAYLQEHPVAARAFYSAPILMSLGIMAEKVLDFHAYTQLAHVTGQVTSEYFFPNASPKGDEYYLCVTGDPITSGSGCYAYDGPSAAIENSKINVGDYVEVTHPVNTHGDFTVSTKKFSSREQYLNATDPLRDLGSYWPIPFYIAAGMNISKVFGRKKVKKIRKSRQTEE